MGKNFEMMFVEEKLLYSVCGNSFGSILEIILSFSVT